MERSAGESGAEEESTAESSDSDEHVSGVCVYVSVCMLVCVGERVERILAI